MQQIDSSREGPGAGLPGATSAPSDTETRYEAVLQAVHKLDELIHRERAAVATLDATAIDAIAAEKRAIAETIAAIADAPASQAGRNTREDRGRRLRDLTGRVVANAEANLALMSDAISVLAEALGISRDVGTYDARARVIHQVRAVAGRNV